MGMLPPSFVLIALLNSMREALIIWLTSFVATALTIMVGLLVAAVSTLLVVPVLYSIFFRVPYEG